LGKSEKVSKLYLLPDQFKTRYTGYSYTGSYEYRSICHRTANIHIYGRSQKNSQILGFSKKGANIYMMATKQAINSLGVLGIFNNTNGWISMKT